MQTRFTQSTTWPASARSRSLILFAALAVASCGTIDRSLQQQVALEAVEVSPPVDDDEEVQRVAVEAADEGPPLRGDTPLPADAGLEDYIQIALRDSPTIRRAVRRVQVLGYEVPQVTSLSDPMVNLIPPTGDMVQTAAGMTAGGVSATQKIPFPGKLSTRGRSVEQSVRMALSDLADARISTIAKVQRAYDAYYLADVSIRITRQSQQLLRQIRDVAAARYRAGTATQQDVLRAEVELYGLTNELITLDQRRTTARALLNSLMNRRVDADLPLPNEFEIEQIEWKLPQAMDAAVQSNPQLARVQAQIKRDLENVRLARLEYLPDLTIGYGSTFISTSGVSPVSNGNDAWNLSFGLNLPIWWQRLRAQVLEMNAQALSSVEQYDELRTLIFFQLQDALVQIDTQYRQAVLLRDLIVPRAWQTVEVSASAYRAGSVDFTPLIDNWRKWLEFSLDYHRALAGLEQRFADLQQLVGMRLPRTPPVPAAQAAVDERSSNTPPEGTEQP